MKLFFFLGAAFAFLSVALGAFGAHGLKNVLSVEQLAIYETAVRYQMYHALALIITALAANQYSGKFLRISGWLFTAGIFLFSGSLYLFVFTGIKIFGAITPFGGLSFLAGWFCLLLVPLKR